MKCEFNDGTRINYSGPLQITKGRDVNIFIKESRIPDDIKSDLDMALFKNSCADMRAIAETVQKMYGTRACIHE
jgi:hypothetical protein